MKNADDKRARRTAQLALLLAVFAAIVFVATFFKLPVWLPSLK